MNKQTFTDTYLDTAMVQLNSLVNERKMNLGNTIANCSNVAVLRNAIKQLEQLAEAQCAIDAYKMITP